MLDKRTEAKFEWKDFPKLKNAIELDNYIKYRKSTKENKKYANLRAYYHGGFYNYSTLKNINKILATRSFLLSNPGESNDREEKKIPDYKHMV